MRRGDVEAWAARMAWEAPPADPVAGGIESVNGRGIPVAPATIRRRMTARTGKLL